ncbi:MAG: hypothetical protein ACRENS_13515 [Candidatus Eiseniibacteriota bacterium]
MPFDRRAVHVALILSLLSVRPAHGDSLDPASARDSVSRETIAAAAPSEFDIERMRGSAGYRLARIWTAAGAREVRRDSIRSAGVGLAAIGEAFATDSSNAEPATPGLVAGQLLPWPSIERVDIQGSNAARGALLGGTAMLGLEFAAGASGGFEDAGAGGALIILLAVPACALAGGIVGSFGHHWTQVWRNPAPVAPAAVTAGAAPGIAATSAVTAAPATPAAPLPDSPPDSHLSPEAAVSIGILSTAGCAIAGAAIGAPDNIGGGLAVGLAAGCVVGPSLGLASGGREDLALRGLKLRGIACALGGAAALAVASSRESGDFGCAQTAGVVIASAAALVTVASWTHDLWITPRAVGQGPPERASTDTRPARWQLGLRPNGALALTAQF